MSKRTQELIGRRAALSNRRIGRLKDVYFDDQSWKVRHLVVGKHRWWPFGKVLVDPEDIRKGPASSRDLELSLTRSELEEKTPHGDYLPVAERMKLEEEMRRMGLRDKEEDASTAPEVPEEARHLRSVDEIIGYEVQKSTGPAGSVEDFVIDDGFERIESVAVKTRDGKTELIPSSVVSSIEWEEKKIVLDR